MEKAEQEFTLSPIELYPAEDEQAAHWAGSISLTEWFNHEKPEKVKTPWLRVETATSLAKLVYPAIDEECSEKELQKRLIIYLAKVCKHATRGVVVRDTHSTALLRPTPRQQPSAKPDGAVFPARSEPTGENIIAVFDLKKGKEGFSKADVAQVLTYCQRILAVEQPGRPKASGFLLNGGNVAFVRVTRPTPGNPLRFKYEYTKPYSVVPQDEDDDMPPPGIAWLHSFFAELLDEIDFVEVSSPFGEEFPHSIFLGRGSSSKVYSVIGHDDKVIKLLHSDNTNSEAEVLRQLARLKVPNVPRVIDAEPEGLVLSPRAADLKRCQFGLRHALQALDTLQAAHEKAGLVHRDIRPANLLFLAMGLQGDILVNDWGSAVSANEQHPYSGTLIHASDTVLRHIAEGKTSFSVGPADDLVSLLRTTFVLSFPRAGVSVDDRINAISTAHVALKLIDWWKSKLPERWVELQDSAVKCKYDELRQGLATLIP